MSPEQCRGLTIDQRTDVYSFGILLYRSLTGQLPFNARTALDIMFQHIHQAPPPVSTINPQLPASFDAPLAAMLAKDAADRPATIEAALDALGHAAAAAGLLVEPISGEQRRLPFSTPPLAESDGMRVVGKLATPTFAQARTVEASPTPGQTLAAAETDIGSRTPRSRAALWLVLLLVAVVAAITLVLSQQAPPATVASPAALPVAPSRPAAPVAQPAASAPPALSADTANLGTAAPTASVKAIEAEKSPSAPVKPRGTPQRTPRTEYENPF
jgi:serine/threonine-protein kinase